MKKVVLISAVLLVSFFVLSQSPVYALVTAHGISRIDVELITDPGAIVNFDYRGEAFAGNIFDIMTPPDLDAFDSLTAGFQSSSATTAIYMPILPYGFAETEALYDNQDPLSADLASGFGDTWFSAWFEVDRNVRAGIHYIATAELDGEADEYGSFDILCAMGLGLEAHDLDLSWGGNISGSMGTDDDEYLQITEEDTLWFDFEPGILYRLDYAAYAETTGENVSAPESIPEPSILFLLGSGLVGIVGYGKFGFRRKKK